MMAQMLQAWAKAKGYDPRLAEKAVKLRKDAVVERLGRKGANEILGEPTPTERYF